MGYRKRSQRQQKTFVADFETTVQKDTESQKKTEVWAAGLCELYTEQAFIFNNIKLFLSYIFNMTDSDLTIYFHNLKFDGSFIIHYLITELDFKQAFEEIEGTNNETIYTGVKRWEMPNNSFNYLISHLGQFYQIVIYTRGHFITILDSLKLLPFSVEQIGKDFETKHKKLTMEYTGHQPDDILSKEEIEYLKNDLFVVKEGLEIFFSKGYDRMTIGSCCFNRYKEMLAQNEAITEVRKRKENEYYPFYPLEMEQVPEQLGDKDADTFIRKSYKGGWCYLQEGYAGKEIKGGSVFDVNSLYPSVMHSESNNFYPVGKPIKWFVGMPDLETKAMMFDITYHQVLQSYEENLKNPVNLNIVTREKIIHELIQNKEDMKKNIHEKYYYFIRFRAHFYLKDGYLPTVQIKGSHLYNGREWLKTSDIWNKHTEQYERYYKDINGDIQTAKPTLTMTCTDFEMFLKHYKVVGLEILGGVIFESAKGIFDEYINTYRALKINAKSKAERTEAKLFLNNLYGKLGTNRDSSFKIAYIRDDNSLGYITQLESNKKTVFVAMASAVTSYARQFTISHAQQNYDNFIYADTDSLHLKCKPADQKGLTIHPKNFLCWANEVNFDRALYLKTKAYIEHVTEEDGETVEPYHLIKYASMNKRCKLLLQKVLGDNVEVEPEYQDEIDFLKNKLDLMDIKKGLLIPSNLKGRNINGGILLRREAIVIR